MNDFRAYSELICDYGVENKVSGEDGYSERVSGKIKIEHLKIRSREYKELLSKPAGDYVSIHFDEVSRLSEADEMELICALSEEIRSFLPVGCARALVVGLGNSDFAVDSVGKRTVQNLNVGDSGRIFAASVDISEHTGIESVDFIRGLASVTAPSAVIVVDSVLTKDGERLARTLQLSDAGISPGAALGAVKSSIDKESLGVPTVAIGVPVVIDSHSMLCDLLWELGDLDKRRADAILSQKKKLFLTPHTIDFIIERFSYIIARAIEGALL